MNESQNMSVKVIYSGILREIAGTCEETLDVTGSKAEVLAFILDRYPSMGKMSFVVSLNGSVTHANAVIRNGDRITMIPPAPGG